jgi:hypothetical protein
MREIAKPFQRLWEYVYETGGFPGQVFFVCAVIILIFGAITWFGNKR